MDEDETFVPDEDGEQDCVYGCGFRGDEELLRYHYGVSTGGYCEVDRRDLSGW
jgi:hypothetical protein